MDWCQDLAALAPTAINLTSTPSEHYEPLHSTRRRYASAVAPKTPRTLLTASRLDHKHAAHTPQDGSAQVRRDAEPPHQGPPRPPALQIHGHRPRRLHVVLRTL